MTTNPKANKALKVREGGCSPVSAPGTGLGEAPSGPRSPGPPWCVRKGACQQGREGAAGWRKYLREAGRVGAVASGDVGEEGWVPAGQDVLVSPAPGCGRMASDPTEPLGLAGVGSPCVCVCVCVWPADLNYGSNALQLMTAIYFRRASTKKSSYSLSECMCINNLLYASKA